MSHWKLCFLTALLLGLAGFFPGAFAQGEELEDLIAVGEEEEEELERLETEIPGLGEEEEFLGRIRLPKGEEEPRLSISQDRPIDPDTYIVGPGDVLQLYIWGEFDLSYKLRVDPEGHILIPTVGDFAVSDKILTEVRELIFAAAQERYEGVEMTLNLTSMRFFTVYLTGAVTSEGGITVHPNMRVSEVIAISGGFIDELRGSISEEIAGRKTARVRRLETRDTARRSVLLTHADGTVDTLDITMFQATGDPSLNPYIQMGDRIHVNFRLHEVSLFGPFFQTGKMEYREGDTIADLVKLKGGRRNKDPIEYAEVWHWKEDSEDYEVIHLGGEIGSGKWIQFEDFDDFRVQPKDQIYIRTIAEWQFEPIASIFGQLRYTGRYRIEEGKTRLRDLVEMAGGFTAEANLRYASAVSTSLKDRTEPELARVQALRKISELRPEEEAYLLSKAIDPRGRIVVDFEALFREGDESHNILIFGGDAFYVPRHKGIVKITGALKNPGLMAYVPDANVDYYIKRAGGYTKGADQDEARLIRTTTGLRHEFSKNLIVEESDEIWVPRKPYRDWWSIVRQSMETTSQVALTVMVLLTATGTTGN